MTKSKKYLIAAGVLVALIIIGLSITLLFFSNNSSSSSTTVANEYNPSGEITQTDDSPTITDSSSGSAESVVNPTINNSDVTATLETPDYMQVIIDQNAQDVNNSSVLNQLAQSYPSNLIPIYKAVTAADSADIITDNGNPGWTAQYGSDATVNEIVTFYQSLMEGTSGYSTETSGNSTVIVGTVENCNVRITVSPNNPERTGLSDASNVSIYIERV